MSSVLIVKCSLLYEWYYIAFLGLNIKNQKYY